MKYSIIHILIIALFFSCNRDGDIESAYDTSGVLKISANMPELEIITKASNENAIFAYSADDLSAVLLNPIAPKIQQGSTYQYEMFEGTTKVLFLNIGSESNEQTDLSVTAEGALKLGLKESNTTGMTKDVVFATLDNIEVGASESRQVDFDRVVAKFKLRLNLIVDGNTIEQSAAELSAASVILNGFSKELLLNSDGGLLYSGDASFEAQLTADEGDRLSADGIYMFPSSGESHKLNLSITLPEGGVQIFEATVNQKLEKNKYYTLTLNLTKDNTDVSFSLADVVVEQTVISDYDKGSNSILTTSSDDVSLKKASGSSKSIKVMTRLTGWTAEIINGSEWFTMDKSSGVNGDDITFTSLSENGEEFRFGKVLIKSEQHEYEVTIQQSNGQLQTIEMHGEGSNITVRGENYTVNYNDGTEVHGPFNIEEDFIVSGSELITIQGEKIEYFNSNSSESLVFDNCYSLKTLEVSGSMAKIVTLPILPKLTSLSWEGPLEELTIAAGTTLEKLSLNGVKIQALNLVSTNVTLKELSLKNCSALTTILIYPDGFTGERKLEKMDIYNCSALTGLNITNFSNLVEFEVSNCENLETLIARNCVRLPKLYLERNYNLSTVNLEGCILLSDLSFNNIQLITLNTEGCNNLKKVLFNNCSTVKVDFSGYKKLEEISFNSCYYLNEILLNECTSLDKVIFEYTNSIQILDLTNCLSLKGLIVNCGTMTSLSLQGCNALLDMNLYNYSINALNLGDCPALESLSLEYNYEYEESILDLTQNFELKSLNIEGGGRLKTLDLSNCNKLEEILFGNSNALTTLNLGGENTLKRFISSLNNSRYSPLITGLDFTGFTELTEVNLNYYTKLTNVNFTGCVKLKSYSGLYNPEVSSIITTGCESLEVFNCNNNTLLGDLNFTDNIVLTELNVGYCNLTVDKIDEVITSLPDLINNVTLGNVIITGNPGAIGYDETAANNKNWFFSK